MKATKEQAITDQSSELKDVVQDMQKKDVEKKLRSLLTLCLNYRDEYLQPLAFQMAMFQNGAMKSFNLAIQWIYFQVNDDDTLATDDLAKRVYSFEKSYGFSSEEVMASKDKIVEAREKLIELRDHLFALDLPISPAAVHGSQYMIETIFGLEVG